MIFLKDNSSYKALGYGFILIQISFGQTLIIYDVLYILGITKNLLRVAQITIIGNTIVTFTNAQCIFTTASPTCKKTIITINKEWNILMLGIGLKPYSQGLVASFSSTLNLDTLKQHHHLGHLNIKSLNTMHFHNMVIGLLHLNIFSPFVKVVFLKNILSHHIQLHWSPKSLNPLFLIHTNVCGLMNTPWFRGALYFFHLCRWLL